MGLFFGALFGACPGLLIDHLGGLPGPVGLTDQVVLRIIAAKLAAAVWVAGFSLVTSGVVDVLSAVAFGIGLFDDGLFDDCPGLPLPVYLPVYQ
jgi:hypothetical protein